MLDPVALPQTAFNQIVRNLLIFKVERAACCSRCDLKASLSIASLFLSAPYEGLFEKNLHCVLWHTSPFLSLFGLAEA